MKFVAKLWEMVSNPDIDHLICWSDKGDSFIILNVIEFSKSVLPNYYTHDNMSSFVRQLNMYGFHKTTNIEAHLAAQRAEVEFAHPYFERDQDHLLKLINRKREVSLATRGLNQIVQEDLDEKLQSIRHDISQLLKEVENLKNTQKQQQMVIDKLIQFLAESNQPMIV